MKLRLTFRKNFVNTCLPLSKYVKTPSFQAGFCESNERVYSSLLSAPVSGSLTSSKLSSGSATLSPKTSLPVSSSSSSSSPSSASSQVTETTRSFSAVRKRITPCVLRPAIRMSLTGIRINLPPSVTIIIWLSSSIGKELTISLLRADISILAIP